MALKYSKIVHFSCTVFMYISSDYAIVHGNLRYCLCGPGENTVSREATGTPVVSRIRTHLTGN